MMCFVAVGRSGQGLQADVEGAAVARESQHGHVRRPLHHEGVGDTRRGGGGDLERRMKQPGTPKVAEGIRSVTARRRRREPPPPRPGRPGALITSLTLMAKPQPRTRRRDRSGNIPAGCRCHTFDCIVFLRRPMMGASWNRSAASASGSPVRSAPGPTSVPPMPARYPCTRGRSGQLASAALISEQKDAFPAQRDIALDHRDFRGAVQRRPQGRRGERPEYTQFDQPHLQAFRRSLFRTARAVEVMVAVVTSTRSAPSTPSASTSP